MATVAVKAMAFTYLLISLTLFTAPAIPMVAARRMSSPRGASDQHPCAMMKAHPTVRPSTVTMMETASSAVRAAAVLVNRYGSLVFVAKPKGFYVPYSSPRKIGHSLNN